MIRKPRHFFTDPQGNILSFKGIDKVFRDTLTHHLGTVPHQKGTATIVDLGEPLKHVSELFDRGDERLRPGKDSPICRKCELDTLGARHPYFEPYGPDEPLITVVLDSVSPKEDGRGELGSDGTAAFLAKVIDDLSKETGVTSRDIRWAPATRCANRSGEKPNIASKGSHCRSFLIQEILSHRPKMLVPIGSVALGLLCHKSNAQDWGGHLLTYRGWPDDWLTNAKFMLPRPDPANDQLLTVGHPLFGQAPTVRIPMFPLQTPRIVYGTQNPQVILRWKNQLKMMLKLAVNGVPALSYDRPWYKLSVDADEIISILQWLIDHPKTKVSYDTETNGLYPWVEGARIVFLMFRWVQDGERRAIGFPWDYPESPLLNHLPRLTPYVLEALYSSYLAAHNGSFDAMFSIATINGCDLNRLAPRFKWDTWHMVYTMRQQRGTLSLDMIANDWVPELAGYEEDMTLLIELHRDTMHPDSGQHAHYARCPQDKWESHLKPYVMGDVEVCYEASEKVEAKLETMKTYRIPLAHPEERGRFRYFQPQSRANVYKHIISPANGMLIKMMARGMKVDVDEIARQEDLLPKQLVEMRTKLRNIDPRIMSWCDLQENTIPGWELDLEKPDHLRSILFKVLELPINYLTDKGVKIYGEKPEGTVSVDDMLQYAKVDKFTLNKLAVTQPRIRPLQEYRKAFKAYSAYIRPIRNAFKEGFDKKPRKEIPHLARDGCIHARFLLTGTRSGRLCVDGDTELKVKCDNTWELVKIKDLNLKKCHQVLIKSHTGRLCKISDKFFKGYETMFEVTTRDSRTITCTGGHRLYTRFGWKHVNSLKVGDYVKVDASFNQVQRGDKKVLEQPIISIKKVGDRPVWDIQVDDDHSYCAGGLIHHNSSQAPNLQQVPRDGLIKRIYCSRFGQDGLLYQGDLSQIELRLIAAACGDEAMVDAYLKDIDLHSLSMSRIFNLPYEHCIKDHVVWLQKNGKDKEAKEMELKRKVAKCVDLETLVSVDGRIQRIGELHPGRDEDTFYPLSGMISGPTGPVPLKHFYSNGVKPRLLVCSKRGIVACSEEHPLLMADGSLKKAKNIQKGDILAEPMAMDSEEKPPVISLNPVGNKAKTDIFAIHVNADLAYLLGLYYGDGECGTSIGICFCGKPEFFEWQDVVVDAIHRCGFETILDRTAWDSKVNGPKIAKSGPMAGQEIHGASGNVTFGSTRVQDIFLQLGAIVTMTDTGVGLRRSLRVPTWLFNSPRELKMQFLAGWFDTDGYAIRGGCISGLTKSWVLVQDICVLLASMGMKFSITPSFNTPYNKYYYHILLPLDDSWLFNAVLRHPKKRFRLREPRQTGVAKHNLCMQVIPLTPGHVVDVEVDTPEHLFVANNLCQRNTINFLTGYGGGAYGLQATLANDSIYFEIEQCENFLESFFDSYPALRKYLAYYKRFILDNAVAVSILGRVRVFEEVLSDNQEFVNKALRAGCNHLIQATASDMMLICLCVIEELMRQDGLESMLVSTVHDSLVIDARIDEIQSVHEIVWGVFNNIPEVMRMWFGEDADLSWLILPFGGDCEVGFNYLDTKKVANRLDIDWDEVLASLRKKEAA